MTHKVQLYPEGFNGASCNQLLRHMYVEWMNNYLTVEKFAEHHEMTVNDAQVLIDLGRSALEHYANKMEEISGD
jgi:hypothetical protein